MQTLRRRLTLTHILVALLAVAIVALLASGLIVRAYDQLVRQESLITREALRTALTQYYLRNRGWQNVDQFLQQQVEQRPFFSTRRIVLANQNGRVLFDSFDQVTNQRLPPRFRVQSTPIRVREQPEPVGFVVIPIGGESRSDPERSFIRSIMNMFLIGSGAAGGVAILVALLISRRVTMPLRSLTLAAQRLAAGERHEALAVPAEAELAELSHAFNSMATNLARQEDLRRQFVADVAHELRTPLSVLRLQVESLEDGVEQPTPTVLASLREEVHLLTHLVEDLRLLSLTDAGQLTLNPEALNANQLLERAAATIALRARQQGIDVRVEGNGNAPEMLADPQRMAQILGNLLENALRYTPRGGQVALRVVPNGSIAAPAIQRAQTPTTPLVILEVADTGAGIAPADLPHVFDRFYRADRARARETGGSGLGLAIVQRLVEAQGGVVGVTSTPGQGTIFQIALPMA